MPDDRVRDLLDATGATANRDVLRDIFRTAEGLAGDDADRLDLKITAAALREMRAAYAMFAPLRGQPKVTIFGSARTASHDPLYEQTRSLAARLAEEGWFVITGAGPGIMEAGNKGAGTANSYGVNIRLPFEAAANQYLAEGRTVNFKYFFTRKLGFVKESHAFAIMPGGFGTLDEAFELITLIQTGKSDLHPIVLLEAAGTNYWGPLIGFVRETLLAGGMISESDMALFLHTDDHEAACDHIFKFYSNYHSQRFTAGKLILRVRQAPTEDELSKLNEDFADIVVEGGLEHVEPNQSEIDDGDALDKERISFYFDRRHFGRLRLLIDRLNDLASLPETTEIPAGITEEQAERPW
jgi:uncharacterized protein (TIGR00730 family)